MTDELEAIRARHEACGHTIAWPDFDSFESHNDRATLLRLLDAARAELAELREALKPFADYASEWDNCDAYGLDEPWPDNQLAYDPVVRIEIGAFRRARAALAKDAT